MGGMETTIYTVAFHDGTEVVEKPEIRKGLRHLDFGVGFYTTQSREQAARWAERQRKVRGLASAVVNRYDIGGLWSAGLSCKTFEGATEEWLDAVVACRRGTDVFAEYDIVVGPVADDNVYETIRLYESGVYTRDEALRRLKTERLFNQLTFKTAKALAYCKFVSSESIEGVRP